MSLKKYTYNKYKVTLKSTGNGYRVKLSGFKKQPEYFFYESSEEDRAVAEKMYTLCVDKIRRSVRSLRVVH